MPESQGNQWCEFWSKSEGLRARSSNIQEQEKIDSPDPIKITRFLLLYLFVVSGPSADWMVPAHIGEGDHLYLVY
jgi:hypothetical protein